MTSPNGYDAVRVLELAQREQRLVAVAARGRRGAADRTRR